MLSCGLWHVNARFNKFLRARHEPIMLLKLPIMLLSNASNFSLLCPNYAPYVLLSKFKDESNFFISKQLRALNFASST